MAEPVVMEDSASSVKLADSDTLALLGKKQVLKRRFGLVSLFGFAMCELITWETVLALFAQGFNNGGPAGLFYGYIIAWLSTLSVYTVISELASMAPIAGGQYYWAYMLAPTEWKKFSSYIIGWLTSLAWIATVATETIFAGTMLQGLLILRYPDYDAKMWQGTLFAWMVVSVAIFINVVIPGLLPKFEIFILVFHVAGFIAIITTLLVLSPHGSASSVFQTSLNEGGWPTQGLSYCVGFLGNVATFVGADASVHMIEECQNGQVNVPRAITISMLANGLLGAGTLLTILFCLGDVQSVLDTKTAFPFLQIFYNSTKSVNGAVTMGAVVLVLTWACAIGIITTASRMTWSFARDKGTPFSRALSTVTTRTKIPMVAVGAVCLLACLLTLIYVGSATAFNDVISLTITGFYGSYFVPSALLLYHRCKGNVAAYGTPPEEQKSPFKAPKSQEDSSLESEAAQASLVWGPWHLPGWFGTLNNIYACVYMIFVIFWSFWPPATPVTASSMNYSVVVTGGVIVLSMVWYVIRARKEYRGPLIDEEVKRIMRISSVVNIDEKSTEVRPM